MITFNVHFIQKIEAMQVILLLCLTTKKPSLRWKLIACNL